MPHLRPLRLATGRMPRLVAPLQRFAGDDGGVSAVEFALLLPVMLTLYLGGVEVTSAVSIDRKVTLVSRTVADLVAQATTVTTADLTDVLQASTAVAAPYSASPLKVTVSSVTIDTSKTAKIVWSSTLNGTARVKDADVTALIPQALRDPCATATTACTLIWGEATYDYKPTIGYVITGTLTLKDQIFMKPRMSNEVTKS
ncbi:pilus assembly protein [Rhodoplanes sp. TEM]|uniref:Pilus assembly protein n=1 Tax=Rhodoplanes tepidamans TaxID=200616 RepID=A0ABT5J7X5_RHOTP|nr:MULTISPECIES: TadE/TadG family type IV pilus assembly protein [Rhodoplanes]MDC7785755.1 pilus assembly protein [Rhodoplanes tepidamans]MDC7984022.1 pilus assembly protein [Rhodoplanes sp. TEM]MDQ0354683.1 Flp pilus assembly protein TadG [Rhodoplanes tepidamans]